ncbi:hypothetical protein PFICI_06795 [Pestalotiopsis fici W106-1]|uniref:Uncharacterized protein n=1 Tax=Pestalotiopsis fici (strain W106-1 / CGMCC3.15140) TaxID=1229662 RepID=W3X6Q9_PESFW|nr:uncharacterized protein PFICI_06795 [Pestalotiopsis fici W106-1]ETS81793.1 hypothetical protein PFICI_06795 [Pestalotiopsis fici W106-1]
MFLKRKRSESELSFSSCSTGSAFNSPTRTGAALVHSDSELASPRHRSMATPSHLHSRTMKRFRDNRPSQDEVHQRTLSMLFSAAQRSETQPHQTNAASLPHHHQQHAPAAHQASLHNFWKLPPQSLSAAASAAMASPPVDTSMYAPADCEDCGRGLCSEDDGDDAMMDVDMEASGGLEAASCAGCGKHVCSHCSITNMGERRRCLGCADTGSSGARKGWAGGLGWNLPGNASSFGIC